MKSVGSGAKKIAELEKRLAEAEARIAMLEARSYKVVDTYYTPQPYMAGTQCGRCGAWIVGNMTHYCPAYLQITNEGTSIYS